MSASGNIVHISQDTLPSSAKNIGQLTNHEENDGAEHNVCKRDPEDVGRRTDVLVDLGQDWRYQTVPYERMSILIHLLQLLVAQVFTYLRCHP